MVTGRSCEAKAGSAGERLVNYLMTCEEDGPGESELAEATQYQNTCQSPPTGTLVTWESKNWKPSYGTGAGVTAAPKHSWNVPTASFFSTQVTDEKVGCCPPTTTPNMHSSRSRRKLWWPGVNLFALHHAGETCAWRESIWRFGLRVLMVSCFCGGDKR